MSGFKRDRGPAVSLGSWQSKRESDVRRQTTDAGSAGAGGTFGLYDLHISAGGGRRRAARSREDRVARGLGSVPQMASLSTAGCCRPVPPMPSGLGGRREEKLRIRSEPRFVGGNRPGSS